ncbi:SOS response-associated peptidase family protein [Mucilaginibacter gynuensis]|uniref:SOS response-associated peptidase family protein n=1 Tax=Mucilaginibacter gynuensis TaxID=1302236 RepID=UPI003CD0692A
MVNTFVMITMPPNRRMAEIHDRMQAILERGDIKTWLNHGLTGTQRLASLQGKPCLSETLKISVEQSKS